jgi:hypothetical protein
MTANPPHHPRRPDWIDQPYQACTWHPANIVRWRCKHCRRNLCIDCLNLDAVQHLGSCKECGDVIVHFSSFDESPAPEGER